MMTGRIKYRDLWPRFRVPHVADLMTSLSTTWGWDWLCPLALKKMRTLNTKNTTRGAAQAPPAEGGAQFATRTMPVSL